MTEPSAETVDYDRHLEEFTLLCHRLIDRGSSFVAVVLCHELFRFLYPVEPFANYTATRPVEFTTTLIARLVARGAEFADALVPYSDGPSKQNDPESRPSLEAATSDLYTDLWKGFDEKTLAQESRELLSRRLPDQIVSSHVKGEAVLDMGCGSGRYSTALAQSGGRVTAVDWQAASYRQAARWCREHELPVRFVAADVLRLPFASASFTFVLSNGVLHHTRSIEDGLRELRRVLKPSGKAFLYLYGAGGIFWNTRVALRAVFRRVPLSYTKQVLRIIGMPEHRFIFCDTWYVPTESHTTRANLEEMFTRTRFAFHKVTGRNAFDLDGAIEQGIPGAREMWGDGEHRYLLDPA